jgi:caa(3)-type oxidase subunit IV
LDLFVSSTLFDRVTNMTTNNHGHGHNEHKHEHHLTPLSTFVKVFAVLIALTITTVVTAGYDFGVFNIVIAMLIATIKAALVILIFMQLYHDDLANKVTFFAAFAFLAIFLTLTASDLFFRSPPKPVQVAQKAAAGSTMDQNVLRVSTPKLIEKGKTSYQTNCVSCHGPNGKGDGIAAASMKPPPRNFTSSEWKYGRSPTRVFATITNGVKGTSMAAWGHLTVEERYALAHYVRSLSPTPPEDSPADLKAAGLSEGGKGSAEKPKEEIPIEVAMELMEVPDQVVIPADVEVNPQSKGAKIFKNACVSCHGLNGGGQEVAALGLNPRVKYITKGFAGARAPWADSQSEFIRVVSQGIPGRGMPGMSGFSRQEWDDLYSYVKQLTH